MVEIFEEQQQICIINGNLQEYNELYRNTKQIIETRYEGNRFVTYGTNLITNRQIKLEEYKTINLARTGHKSWCNNEMKLQGNTNVKLLNKNDNKQKIKNKSKD